jgi:hypothetical protein
MTRHLAFPCKMMWTKHRADFTLFQWAGWLRPDGRRYRKAVISIGDFHPEPFGTEPTCVRDQFPSVLSEIGKYSNEQGLNLDDYDDALRTFLLPHPSFDVDFSCYTAETLTERWRYDSDISGTEQMWKLHAYAGSLDRGYWDALITYSEDNPYSDFLDDAARLTDDVPWDNPVYYDPHHSEQHSWGFNSAGILSHLGSVNLPDPGCVVKPDDSSSLRTAQYDTAGRLDAIRLASIFRLRPLRQYRRKHQTFTDPTWTDIECDSFTDQPTERTLFMYPVMLTTGTPSTQVAERYLFEWGKLCA